MPPRPSSPWISYPGTWMGPSGTAAPASMARVGGPRASSPGVAGGSVAWSSWPGDGCRIVESLTGFLLDAAHLIAEDLPLLPDQFRHRPMVADQVLRPAGEVGELRGGDVNPQALVERGEHVAEVDRPGARLL